MGESQWQIPIFALRSGSQCRNGKAQSVLRTLCQIGCPYPGNGYFSFTPLGLVLTRVLVVVLNPKKKMAHFTKHWPPELFEEVESVVRERVSPSTSIRLCMLLTVLHFSLKFVERYKVRNANEQGQVKHACRVAAPSSKLGHRNVDDTDSSSDDEDYLQASSTVNYLEEWNLYLNTNEIMPDDIGIVGWWGVHHMLLFLFYHRSSQFSSYMGVTTRRGNRLLVTTYQSWPLLSQVNGHFLRLA